MKLNPVEQRRILSKLRKLGPLEFSEAYEKILQWFFSYPQIKIGLNDLSTELKISKTTARRIVMEFIAAGILSKEIFGNVWQITFNPSHKDVVLQKIPYNLRLIYASGILEAIHEQFPNPLAIVLFGSYRKGDDTEKSDIDIAVEIAGKGVFEVLQLGVLPQLGYRQNVPVNLHIFSRDKIDPNLFANIANGIVLEGFLEVKP